MSETNCPNCAATLPGGAMFCTSCGHRMAAESSPPPSSGESSPPQSSSGGDATRIDTPAVSDATQTYSPGPPQAWNQPGGSPAPSGPPASAPWQPAEAAPGGAPPPSGPPTSAPWNPPANPPAPPWQQAQTPGPPQQSQAPVPPQQWGAPAPAPGQGTTKSGGSPIGAILALIGGILALVGLFTAWVEVNVADTSATGWSLVGGKNDLGLKSNDPYILLALGVAALVIGVLMFTGTARTPVRLVAGVIGLAIIGLAVRDWLSIADLAKDLSSEVKISAQFGFYLTVAGGVVTAVATVMPSSKSS